LRGLSAAGPSPRFGRREVALKLNMSWYHPDKYFFLCLAGRLAAFLAPSIIDELTSTIGELFGRKRKPPVVEPRRSIVDPPSPPKYPPLPPKKYLENVKPLDGLQRDRPRPAAERFRQLCEKRQGPPAEGASMPRG
jgi:hypothetical protein